MSNVIPMRKPRDHHGEALERALALETRPFTESERRLNADLANHLEREFERDPKFRRRAEESM